MGLLYPQHLPGFILPHLHIFREVLLILTYFKVLPWCEKPIWIWGRVFWLNPDSKVPFTGSKLLSSMKKMKTQEEIEGRKSRKIISHLARLKTVDYLASLSRPNASIQDFSLLTVK